MNIPQTGPNPQKSRFFCEISQAFEFLEVFYTLSAEQQSELMTTIIRMQSEALSPKSR